MALIEYKDSSQVVGSYYLNSANYFEEPGILTVLAVPVHGQECMFIPYPGPFGKMFEKMNSSQQSGAEGEKKSGENDAMRFAFGELDSDEEFEPKKKSDSDEREDDAFRNDFGEDDFAFGDVGEKYQKKKGLKGWWERRKLRRFDRESKTDKFLKRIPDNVEHIRIIYPQSMGEENIQNQLNHQITKTQSRRSAKVIGLTAALPFALLLDLITLTFVFTVSDVAMIVNSSKKLKKGKIVEDMILSKHISFVANDVLDSFYKKVEDSQYKMPDNYTIEELCKQLNAEPLLKTIRKVRNSKANKAGIDRAVFEYKDTFAHEMPSRQRSYAALQDVPIGYIGY